MNINEAEVLKFNENFKKINDEIKKGIIGQEKVIRNVLIAVLAGGNVLLEGLPGLGKTQLVKVIGKVLDLRFSRIQFTPDLMPSDVTGTNILIRDEDGNSKFKFQEGPVFSNIVLADEINRATPKTQSTMLEAMQERTVTVGGHTYELPSPFFVLATQNPLEMEGTYPLPEAQMDRFMFKIDVDFPSKKDLMDIVMMTTGNATTEVSKIINGETLLNMREISKDVPIADSVAEYAMEVILKTHPDYENAPEQVKKYVRYGSSPRGAQAIITGAKINAMIEGRYNVAFEDIKSIAPHVLRHRLFLNFEGVAEGVTPDMVISNILEDK